MTQSPASSGYATLFDPEGVIVYHPDSLKLGRPASDPNGTGGVPEGRGNRTARHRSCDLGLSRHRRGAHLLPHSAGRTPLGGGHRHPPAGHRAGDRRFPLLHGFRRRDLGAVLRRAARPGPAPLAPRIRPAPPFGTGVGTAPPATGAGADRPPLPVQLAQFALRADPPQPRPGPGVHAHPLARLPPGAGAPQTDTLDAFRGDRLHVAVLHASENPLRQPHRAHHGHRPPRCATGGFPR